MTTPNAPQQAGGFAAHAAVDTAADGAVNSVLQDVEHSVTIPGGPVADQMIQTEVDQVVNNLIDKEVGKGVSGVMGDVEGMFGHHH